ncbi:MULTISPECIES: hypothetical protein [Myroides]|uniref:Antitoxin component YwqK of the YwqJK toxin-antitoxin module n=1 Tax=Myroides albus TaxID=2562892 RepID=A0A6I3LPY8_9FLAO|nr:MULTISPECIES: hypothetical protein [Myroides]MTG98172.1 hypothetical protein [Myroides albus]MVX35326.1 hypothetical protein [Myroides sp. LoEW2-1]UVD78663.1 hypothetical protein NWE55_11080 [Myroides albus]
MIKKILPLAILFATPVFSQVAKDTIWVDSYDYIVQKKDAKFFKIAKPIKGNTDLKTIEVYNAKTNKIESKGNGTFMEGNATALYQGDVQYFDTNGKVNSTFTYDENNSITKLTSIDPRNGKVYNCEYYDNNVYSGEALFNWNGVYVYIEVEDGVYYKYEVINPKNDKNKLTYQFDENNYPSAEEYFDENGVSTYAATYQEGQLVEGESVTINYSNFSVQSVSKYTDSKILQTTNFYTTGQIKSKSVVSNNITTEEYFDKNGKLLGTYRSELDSDGYSTKSEGVQYYFNVYDNNPDDIYSVYHYKNNVMIKSEDYYVTPKNNTVKSIIYSNENYQTLKKEFYNEDGTLKSQLLYDTDGYTPKDGTDYSDNLTITYKNAKIVERIELYSNGKPFEITKNNLSIYYDTKGKELGRLTYKEEPMYGGVVNISGTQYTMSNDLISSISKYEKEQLVYEATYETTNGQSTISSETFYQNQNISKVVEYYNNGNKASISQYSPATYTYSPIKQTFYDKTGKELGIYDHLTQTGTLVDFTYDKQISAITKFKDGKTLAKKIYALKQNTNSTYYLQADIDYNKQGKFYSEKGEIISTATYKDGAAFEGTVWENDLYYLTETTYKKGLKVGKEIVKYVHSDEIVTINYYDNQGNLTKSEIYSNNVLQSIAEYQEGVLHGATTYYDNEGEVLSTLVYHNGYPYEGTLTSIDYMYYNTTEYVNGIIQAKKMYLLDIDGKTPTTLVLHEEYENSATFSRTINDSTTGTPIYKYNVKDNYLDGQYQYFESGKIKYQATFKDGVLTDGTVAINDLNQNAYNYYSESPSNYTLLTSKKGNLTVKILNEDHKELFVMEAKVKKGDSSLNPLTINKITVSNLFPYNEFNSESYYHDNYGYDYGVPAAEAAVEAAEAAEVPVPVSAY